MVDRYRINREDSPTYRKFVGPCVRDLIIFSTQLTAIIWSVILSKRKPVKTNLVVKMFTTLAEILRFTRGNILRSRKETRQRLIFHCHEKNDSIREKI